MKKVKIIPDNKKMKPFEIELKQITMDEREEINNMIFDTEGKKNFSWFLKVIELGTNLTREKLNEFSNDELFAISAKVIEVANKKK
tara:strand:+ start:319 stop:576 length:258 start_codon:yes stop_codon:yes gene_type:complete